MQKSFGRDVGTRRDRQFPADIICIAVCTVTSTSSSNYKKEGNKQTQNGSRFAVWPTDYRTHLSQTPLQMKAPKIRTQQVQQRQHGNNDATDRRQGMTYKLNKRPSGTVLHR